MLSAAVFFFGALVCQESQMPTERGSDPEIEVVLDGLASWNPDAGIGADLRVMEILVSSELSPLGRAYATVEFPKLEEVEIAEAVFAFSGPHDDWGIRAGRLLVDFGRWNTVHLHELPTLQEDPIRTGLLGGRLAGTGLELHQEFEVGNAAMTFSLGAFSEFHAHGHSSDSHGHADHGGVVSGVSGAMGLRDWGFSGRIAAQHDWGSNSWLEWGLSGFTTPHGLASSYEISMDEEETAFGLNSKTWIADFAFQRASIDSANWTNASLEYWFHSAERAHFDGTLTIERPGLRGLWGIIEQGTSAEWSRGAHGAVWEVFENDGSQLAGRVGLHLSRYFGEEQRFRFGVDYGRDDPEEEKTWTIGLQWSSFFGGHQHNDGGHQHGE